MGSTPPSPSTQPIPRLRMTNDTWHDDVITNSSSATSWEAGASESDMVLVLSVVAAVGIVLILCLLLAAVAICRLRKLTGSEPQLLTFSQSPVSKPRSSVTGFINKAYEETPMPPSCIGEASTSVHQGACETSDTESSNAADASDDLQPTKRTAPKVPPRRHLPEVGIGHVTGASGVTSSPLHAENGISECVNPLYTKDKNNKPYVSLPLEAITEGDDDDDDGLGNSSKSPEVGQPQKPEVEGDTGEVVEVCDLDRSCVLSTTFHDVDDTTIGPAPGVNMAEAVSATQSCPNTPLMSPGGGTDRTLPPCGKKVNWASDSRLPDDGGDDGYRPAFSERGKEPASNQQDEADTPVHHGSWMGQLDANWEAETTF